MKNFLLVFLCILFIVTTIVTLALCKAAGRDKDRYTESDEYCKLRKDDDKIS